MIISHEAPLSIIEKVSQVTGMEYALVHLFKDNPEYYAHFKAALLRGREVLLDNSIFELGVAFDSAEFAKCVEELKPTFYIVPDVLEDAAATIQSFCRFDLVYSNLPGLKIGVVQGKTYQELVECYQYMSENADYIAISFDYSWYQTCGLSTSNDNQIAKLEKMCSGRQNLIGLLSKDGIWNRSKPHHLLGGSLVREFSAYKNIPSIRSCDTSNPVMCGLHDHRYIKGIGNLFKPKGLLADRISQDVTDEQWDTILHNIDEFRGICNQ